MPYSIYTQHSPDSEDDFRHHSHVQRQANRMVPVIAQHSQSAISAPTRIGRVDTVPTSGSSETFAERQIVHFAMVLGRKWACTEPGHEMCFTGQGKHVPLTDDMIMAWVTALCNGEATTHIPPFIFSEDSKSDSDTRLQHQYLMHISSASSSFPPSSIASAAQTPRLPKTIRKYPSSVSLSPSQASRMSTLSSSSWRSAATESESLFSSAAASTQSEDMSPSQGGSTVKFSPVDSEQYSSSMLSSSPMSATSFQRPQQRPLSPNLSPPSPRLPPPPHSPPVLALPLPPRSPLSNPLQPARPDSPVHSLNSEFSDRLSTSLSHLQQPQQPQMQQLYHNPPYRHASLPLPSDRHRPNTISHQFAPPPRPPRHQDRPQSPEIHSKMFEQPRTPPRTPPQPISGLALPPTASAHPTPPLITPTRSGQVFSGLRPAPYIRANTYPTPSPSTSASTTHVHSSHSSHTPYLTHVREEDERFDPNPDVGCKHDESDNVESDEVDVDADEGGSYDPRTGVDHHPYPSIARELDAGGNKRTGSNGGKSDIESQGGSTHGDHELSDHGSLGGSEAMMHEGKRSVWSPYTSFLPSLVTAPGGNAQTPSITSTVRTKWIESAALRQRAKNHLNRIKKWRKRATSVVVEGRYSKRGKEGAQVGNLERNAVIEMIGDGIEMARSCYSPKIHKLGYELGKEVQQWLQTFTDNDPAVLYKKENISLLTTIQTCFLPILLMRIADIEPQAATLANHLIVSLTKVPLSLHENEIQQKSETPAPLFTSPPGKPGKSNKRPSSSGSGSLPSPASPTSMIPIVQHRTTSISSIAIHLVAQELGSDSPACPKQHPWLGMTLSKIVEMSLKIRHISVGEMEDIRSVARKREGEYPPDGTSFPALIDGRFTRPWEVALFGLCATTDGQAAAFFRRMVLGPMGIPVLMKSLDSMLSKRIDMDDVKWEDVGLTLRAIASVSEQAWVVQGMNSGEDTIRGIMGVFWRDIPTGWFSIRFWAMDAVRNIVSHRPPLVRLLAEMKADQAFITLTPTSSLYPSVISTTRMVNEAGEKVRSKMLEEYRKESAKRAQEMVDYIRLFRGAGDRQNAERQVVLQPVSIGFDGR